MQPPDSLKGALAADWLRKAEDDVQAAELLMANSPGLANPIVFHAQQAVEKYLKGFLTWRQVHFPKTHDIERLLVLVESVDKDLADVLADTTVLTIYGVDVRYPGNMPEATSQEAQEGLVPRTNAQGTGSYSGSVADRLGIGASPFAEPSFAQSPMAKAYLYR